MALLSGGSGIMAAKPQPIPGAQVGVSYTSSSPALAGAASPSSHPNSQQQLQPQLPCHSSSYSSSPRQLPSDLPDPILEESIESGSDYPAEPITPTSRRHSQEWATIQAGHYNYLQPDETTPNAANPSAPLHKSPSLTPQQPINTAPQSEGSVTTQHDEAVDDNEPAPEPESAPLTRRSTRGSTSSFKRTMSSIFRRSAPQVASPPSPTNGAKDDAPATRMSTSTETNGSRPRLSQVITKDSSLRLTPTNGNGPPPSKSSRRFSLNRSANTTRSNTPPSPTSPLEMTNGNNHHHAPSAGPISESLPTSAHPDFSSKKKNRSSTGLSLGLRGRAVNFVHTGIGHQPSRRDKRRANSFDSTKRNETPVGNHDDQHTIPPERLPWALPPDAGTGAKARRMSLSLPDDFTVDVVELTNEFEYQSKFLGRHGKHLGKGAASKVALMSRKGCPTELYAVKEFRGKSNRESKDDYDKKIKSEYSIAKSLHHPNIVETFRLCSDHGRWNHVMEYCSEGDLFSLVSKGWLKPEDKKKDRLCLFKQLVQGVAYLHSNGIAHRDIKLENLLITKDSKLKITDFGVSEVYCGTHPGLREAGGQCGQNMAEVRLCSPGICGSEPYIAPEVLAKKDDYDPRPLDVWSTAVVMIYLIFGGAIWPRAEVGINKVYDNLVRGWDKWTKAHPDPEAGITDMDYPHCDALDFAVSPPALRRLMLQMLHPNPSKRISIHGVINNRWMKNVECCQLESYEDPTQIIDATKNHATWNGPKKIFCHSHLPPKTTGSHSLGKMPGQVGY